jgi:hypothetical protein
MAVGCDIILGSAEALAHKNEVGMGNAGSVRRPVAARAPG